MRMISAVAACALTAAAAVLAQTDPQALQRMVATERAFAAATAEIGVRDGFLAFFSDDSVQIVRGAIPSLVPARDALALQPQPKLPLPNRLIWEPYTGHVSSDGTLGWLTGGYVSMNQATRDVVTQGAYFSVWKRQANGTWRVWLDEGIRLPQIWRDASPFRVAPEPDAGETGTPGEALTTAEAAIAADGANWRARLGSDVRLHLDGQMPIVGREAVLASPRAKTSVTCRILRTEAAASNDLAVTIGAFDAAGSPASHGTFVRVWKRDVGGRWRVVFQAEKDSQ